MHKLLPLSFRIKCRSRLPSLPPAEHFTCLLMLNPNHVRMEKAMQGKMSISGSKETCLPFNNSLPVVEINTLQAHFVNYFSLKSTAHTVIIMLNGQDRLAIFVLVSELYCEKKYLLLRH